MPIDPEKVIETALKSGFGSELKAAAIISGAGWTPNQSVYYIDKDEDKGRELDIEAYLICNETDKKPEATCGVELIIEVKKTSNPFIFYTSDAKEFEYGSSYSLLHWNNKVSNKVLDYTDIEKFRPIANPERIARSYSQMGHEKDGHDKKNQIQAGILSAVKAAVHFNGQCNETYSDTSKDIFFFIPMLVVDGPIFECYFNVGSSKMMAREVHELVYMQNYLSPSYGDVTARVHVVSLSVLPSILAAYRRWAEHMVRTMKSNVQPAK